ncbi:DUF402 domain-containing protein [Chryseomicrobium palamuruense]|uniref:DUF402 domain-containing protein n=1 Tax=Chryseomicrobium palamuruense TaxID=682973 RepID=A0ABV8UTF9_9BACL
MVVRRYGNRADWKRIKKRNYIEQNMETMDFKGHVCLIEMQEVIHPLDIPYPNQILRIVDNGYSWLQHFPADGHHAVTTMFNENHDVIQTYIDICLQNGVDENGPWWEDLYLDLIVFPSGEILLQDEDELEEAFTTGVISKSQYTLAWNEVERLRTVLADNQLKIMELAPVHRRLLSTHCHPNDSK